MAQPSFAPFRRALRPVAWAVLAFAHAACQGRRDDLPRDAGRAGAAPPPIASARTEPSVTSVPAVPSPNEISQPVLMPRLLQDQNEMASYLRAFPRDAYRVYDVPEVGKFYLDDIDDTIKSTLRGGDMWEPHIYELLVRYAKPGSTVLDVGAHIGTHTLTLARRVGSAGRVYAFEPQKKIYRELVRNLELNRIDNVVPLRFAIGSRPQIIEMAKTAEHPGRRNEGGLAVGQGGDRAELRTIDSFGFKNVSLVKMDVEGYEDPVLEGAAATLRAHVPVLLVEIQGGRPIETAAPATVARIKATIAKLVGLGYEVKRLRGEDYLAFRPGLHPAPRYEPTFSQAVSVKGAQIRATPMSELAHWAVDGSRDTRWHSGALQNGTEMIELDLGRPTLFRQLRLELGSADWDYGRSIVVDVAENAGSYREVLRTPGLRVRLPNLDTPGDAQRLTLPSPVTARYVRIRQIGRSAHNHWSVAEISLYR